MFKPSLISMAVTASLLTISADIVAQEAQSTTENDSVEVIEVSGIRGSLAKAIDIKREKIEVVDSIVAEDIGKFPDNNVIEALQRVPGVQVTNRDRGEVGTLSIRGLTDITTTVNGRQMYISTGRFYTMADTPAALINRVDVYKARSADKVPSGIAGQVDVITQRPFNFEGEKFVFAGRGIYSDQEGSVDPNISALASNTWETDKGKFGGLLNLAYSKTNWRDQSITAGAVFPYFTASPEGQGLDRFGNSGEFPAFERINSAYWNPGMEMGLPNAAGSTLNTNGFENEYLLSRDAVFANDLSGKRERPAVNLSLQFAPNDTSEYIFEAFYNGYRERVRNSMFFAYPDSSHNINFDDDIVLYEGTNIVKERTVYDGDPRYGIWETDFNSTDVDERKTDTYMVALGGEWQLTDDFHLSAEVVSQKSTFTSDFFAVRLLRDYYAVTADFNTGEGVAGLTYHDNPATTDIDESDLYDPRLYSMGPAWDNGAEDEGTSDALYVDANWFTDFAGITEIKFGLLYEKREVSNRSRGATINVNQYDIPMTDMPEEFLDGTEDFFDGRAEFPDGWLIGNTDYMVENKDYFRSLYGFTDENGEPADDYLTGGPSLILRETFAADETTVDVYAEANFEYFVPGGIFDGTFGVRYTDAKTPYTFTRVDTVNQLAEQDSGENNSSEVLPTFIARYNFMDDYILRFSYTETMRRPDFNAMNPYTTYTQGVTSVGTGTASSGNPDLEPVISTNLDVSLEYYFGEGNALYATWFNRDIEGLVVNSRSEIYYDYPDDVDQNGEEIGPLLHILTQPNNSANGKLEGYELGLIYFPDNLPDILQGIGIQASYTSLDSSQDLPVFDADDPTNPNPIGYDTVEMFGVSDQSYSVVLAYEKERFGTRLSYVWRDAFRYDNEAATFANPLARYRAPEQSLDFQFSYNVNENLVLTFDATNLTDEIFNAYYQYPDTYNFSSGIYSRTFALGVRYQM
ncbi:TonB-dependent receptor [Alteromonas pelagimontana]|uniref:TonB-dependent receptor n=1 Tax=Alteromonas pelagimontana TaxID=1858656 RepID=A0A6M4MDS6_9ALTE|nr:TonB-dependent receptor [Alteromonas pelagimontana]QJR81259.1 TonB-dependent receptor [Alteromonas pelagimontana]